MEQNIETIYKFKKGDIITRLLPVKDSTNGSLDYSLVGKKLIFLGIANASVYLTYENANFLLQLFIGKESQTLNYPLALVEAGWGFYVEPDFLITETINNEVTIQKQLDKAVENQEFEKAEELKRKLDELKTKK
jgi:hypothetical protein